VRALEKRSKIEEVLEDPEKIFNVALEILREEYPEDFEDPYLVEKHVSFLAQWINELQLELKLLYIFQNQDFSFKACVKTCIEISHKSRSECTHRCGLVKAVLLESRFNEPPI
jgi:hypothetical protein